MTTEKLGWIVFIPLATAAILIYVTMPRGVAIVCVIATVILVARLLFAKRM